MLEPTVNLSCHYQLYWKFFYKMHLTDTLFFISKWNMQQEILEMGWKSDDIQQLLKNLN